MTYNARKDLADLRNALRHEEWRLLPFPQPNPDGTWPAPATEGCADVIHLLPITFDSPADTRARRDAGLKHSQRAVGVPRTSVGGSE